MATTFWSLTPTGPVRPVRRRRSGHPDRARRVIVRADGGSGNDRITTGKGDDELSATPVTTRSTVGPATTRRTAAAAPTPAGSGGEPGLRALTGPLELLAPVQRRLDEPAHDITTRKTEAVPQASTELKTKSTISSVPAETETATATLPRSAYRLARRSIPSFSLARKSTRCCAAGVPSMATASAAAIKVT
jgi:hypothetical protein